MSPIEQKLLASELVLLPEKAIQDIKNPEPWHGGASRGNWRRYVPHDIEKLWAELSFQARLAVYIMAQARVSEED
jgi:hypothetical protein